MQLIETALGRFGSRFTLHFLPFQQRVCLSPLGKYFDREFDLALGFQVGSAVRVLPFTRQAGTTVFPEIEMEISLTSVIFRGRDRALGLAATFTFVAPFYPKDEPLCTAPFFYLTVRLDTVPANTDPLLISTLSPVAETGPIEVSPAQEGLLNCQFRQIPTHWGPHPAQDSLSDQIFEAQLQLKRYQPTGVAEPGEINLLLASYLAEPVLEVKGELHRFLYTSYFDSLAAVCNYAIEQEETIRAKSARFDEILNGSSMGKSARDLIAFSFQSYVINTWLTFAGDAPKADWWFSVWEGNCAFHSTVDVEYNLAWFYLQVWPELLQKTLHQWQGYLQTDERGSWLSHDIGGLLGANRQAYPHHMEVEENCNYVLLTYTLWRTTGQAEVIAQNMATVARLLRFVLDSDTTGNGFPNRGIANTVDDASPAVQFGKEQIYLAVKALSACWAGAVLLERSGQAALADECRARVSLIIATLDGAAWQGDHYAVTLDRNTAGLINPWTGQPLPPGELTGWDAYTLYTGNGLLYLLATTPAAELPPLNYDRFRQDLQLSTEKSLLEYGCTHSSADRSHIWISQNLWRDLVGAYLNVDLSNLSERYWAFEQFENGPQGRGGCFVDTYGGNHLRYYPRGITSLGLLAGLAGMRLDRPNGRLSFRPVRVPLRVPVLALADWQSGVIPWVEFELVEGRVTMSFENGELLEKAGLHLELFPAE